MHAHTPPYTKPTGAYDARKLYDETGKIAAAPDTRLDPVSVMNHRARVMPLVLADLEARIAKGAKDYGEPLTTHNGRDALWDAYEEALDLCLYLRQAIEERIQSVSAISSPEREKVCTCPSGDGSLRWPCPAHMAGHANERIPKWSPQWLAEQGIPAESAYLASATCRRPITTPTEIDAMREVLTDEELKGLGIGDVEPRHPLHAEVLRDEYEKGDGETGV